MSSDSKNKGYLQEPAFEGDTEDIKVHFFFYGRVMSQKLLTSSKKFLNHIGIKFWETVKQSIDSNSLLVVDIFSL